MFEFEMKSSNGEILPLDPVTRAGWRFHISPALSAGVSWRHDEVRLGCAKGSVPLAIPRVYRTVKTHRNT